MRNILFVILVLLPAAARAACTKITMPTDFASVTSGTRANLKANFTEIETRVDNCIDSVDEVRARLSGYSTSLAITSLENLRLRLDGDASSTGKLIVEGSNGDTLFRVSEDSTARFFGALTGTNLTLSGTATTTGAHTFTAAPIFSSATASRLLATDGSKGLASVADLTSWIAGTANQITSTSDGDGSLTLSLPSDVVLSGSIALGSTDLSGPATTSLLQNSDYNTIDAGTHTNILLGGNSTFGNFIGTTGLPEGTGFTPTGWSADVGYVDNAALVASVLGGHDNISNSIAGIVVGGGHNFVKYDDNGHSIIGGGSYNVIGGGYSGIFSGRRNTITGGGDFSVIPGGDDNNIVGSGSTVVGGTDNDITGNYSVVGGTGNRAKSYSNLFGNNISAASYSGVTAFTDSVLTTLSATANNQFIARFQNGYTFNGGAATFAGALTSGALTATSGSFSSTLSTTGLHTASGGVAIAGGSSGAGTLWRSATGGLALRATTGSSNDFVVEGAAGNALLRNPTGTLNLEFPQSTGTTTFSGPLVASSTLGVTGAATFTAAPVFSSVTASQFLLVDGSKALTSVAGTGSGSVVRATSPTLVTPVIGAATGTSLTLSDLTASRLMASDGSKSLASVSDLTSWIAGTANQITSTSDGDGSLTLSLPSAVTLPGSAQVTTTLGVTGATTLAGMSATTGSFSSTITRSADDIYTPTTHTFRANTSDGSDSKALVITGGGAGSGSRGATVQLYGNENATLTGVLRLIAGDVAGSSFQVYTGSTERLNISQAGVSNFTGNVTIGGTLGVTGAATFTAAPVFSSVTASQFLLVDGSKALTSVAGTGSGSVVRATSPTITTPTFSGTVATGLTASRTLVTDASGNMSVNTETGSGSHVLATSPTITTPTITGLTASRTLITDGSGNMAVNTETGTGDHVRATSPTLVTPVIGAATGTSLSLSGSLTADTIISSKMFTSTSFTVTLTGVSGTVTGTAYAQLIGGNVVVLELPALTGTSNSTSATITGIPAGWRPAREISGQPAIVYDDAATKPQGMINIATSGTITLYFQGASTFTASGLKGIDGLTITYIK